MTAGPTAPNNVGPKGMPDYATIAAKTIVTAGSTKVFVGPREDPFFIDVGRIFDLLALGAAAHGGAPGQAVDSAAMGPGSLAERIAELGVPAELVLARDHAGELRAGTLLVGRLRRRTRWKPASDAETARGRYTIRRTSWWQSGLEVVEADHGSVVLVIGGPGLTGRRRITPTSGGTLSYARRGVLRSRLEVKDAAGATVIEGTVSRRVLRLRLVAQPLGVDPALLPLVVGYLNAADEDAATTAVTAAI